MILGLFYVTKSLKNRNVRSDRQDDVNGVQASFTLIVALQPLAQAVGAYANDRVDLRVEPRAPSKRRNSNVVFLDFMVEALEAGFTDIGKELAKGWSAPEIG